MTYEYKLIFRVKCFDFTKIFDHDALNLCIFKYSYTIKKFTRLKNQ